MRMFAREVLRSLIGVLDLGMTRVDIQTYAWTRQQWFVAVDSGQ